MKFATRHDLGMPIDALYAALCDTDRWERRALRRGVEVQRTDPPGPAGVGAGWQCRFIWRGRPRDLALRLTRMDAPQRLEFTAASRGYQAEVTVELLALSPLRTRVITRTDLRATTLASRILLQSARLAKTRLHARLQARTAALFALIEDRHRRPR